MGTRWGEGMHECGLNMQCEVLLMYRHMRAQYRRGTLMNWNWS